MHEKAQKRRRNIKGHGKQKVQLVLKEKVQCVRGKENVKGENKGFWGKKKGTKADDQNQRLREKKRCR